jgi:segregation and condensation protein B
MAVIEAILFVAGEPVLLSDLQKALEVSPLELDSALNMLDSDYEFNRRGIRLKRFGDHIQLATRAEYAPYVEKLLQPVQKQSLSQAAMETLAVVAYRQPVTKAEVEAIRGVKCDYSVQSLSHKGLIEEVGRKETLGRPILYGTTDAFLGHFGIASLADLPKLSEGEADHEQLIP